MSTRHKQLKKLSKYTTVLFLVDLLCVLLAINSYAFFHVISSDTKARTILLRACYLEKVHCMPINQAKKAYFISEAKYHPVRPPSDIMVNPLIPPPPYRFSQLV
jgi:hypothetical protein